MTATNTATATKAVKTTSKLDILEKLLKRRNGASIADMDKGHLMAAALGARSVRRRHEEARAHDHLGQDRRHPPLPHRGRAMIAEVEQLVDEIGQLDLDGLRQFWRERYGAPPPLRSVPILRQMLAWRVQAQALGGLDEATRRPLARSGPLQAGADISDWAQGSPVTGRGARLPWWSRCSRSMIAASSR